MLSHVRGAQCPETPNPNDRTQVAKVETMKMTTENNIARAIARSVSHNEIVRCNVAILANGLRAVSEQADVEDSVELDDMSSDKRFIDVWGKTYDGDDFRLYLFAE